MCVASGPTMALDPNIPVIPVAYQGEKMWRPPPGQSFWEVGAAGMTPEEVKALPGLGDPVKFYSVGTRRTLSGEKVQTDPVLVSSNGYPAILGGFGGILEQRRARSWAVQQWINENPERYDQGRRRTGELPMATEVREDPQTVAGGGLRPVRQRRPGIGARATVLTGALGLPGNAPSSRKSLLGQ